MVEHHFYRIALEHSSKMEDNSIDIHFLGSCSCCSIPETKGYADTSHKARVHFADGQTVAYQVPVIMAQVIPWTGFFERTAAGTAAIPYFTWYEHFLKASSMSQKKLDRLLEDYRNISQNFTENAGNRGKIQLSINLVDLINQIC